MAKLGLWIVIIFRNRVWIHLILPGICRTCSISPPSIITWAPLSDMPRGRLFYLLPPADNPLYPSPLYLAFYSAFPLSALPFLNGQLYQQRHQPRQSVKSLVKFIQYSALFNFKGVGFDPEKHPNWFPHPSVISIRAGSRLNSKHQSPTASAKTSGYLPCFLISVFFLFHLLAG